MVKAALVTGGSSGIGLAIARALKEDGYDLTLVSRTRERCEAAAAELGAHSVTANVGVPEECAGIVASHRERFGRLDVLVNGAGVGVGGKLEDLAAKYVALQLNVNLTGLVL